MDTISLQEIEALARDESAKMQHFYVGVEHLFVALTRLEGGLTPGVLEKVGQDPRYLRYAIREMIGRGDERRYWSGYPLTPRAMNVLEAARKLIGDGIHPDECALLLAIIEEGKSVPMRILRRAKVDLEAFWRAAIEWSKEMRATLPPTAVEGGEVLDGEQRAVLQQMFRTYSKIRIERLFTENLQGYSGSTVMLVRPLHADGRSDALVVVKLHDQQAILWEKKRYDSFVRDRLPPKTSRIEADPTLPNHTSLGGLKYTFIRPGDEVLPINLAQFAATHDGEAVARFLREALFGSFQETWWGQARAYTFAVWQEYELTLPPALVLEALPEDAQTPTGRVLRASIQWSGSADAHPGEIVALEDFTVVKVRRGTDVVQLAMGAGPEAINYAGRVDVHGLDVQRKPRYRGELIRRLVARVARTRDDMLQEQVLALEPDFNILDETLPPAAALAQPLPNPLRRYARLLARRVTGTLSTIHGDLHTGNVLIGSGGDAWLIDFEWARDGHTLFDWAVLEVSLLIDHVVEATAADWESARRLVVVLDGLNQQGQVEAEEALAERLRPVVAIRHIVGSLLAARDDWSEYYTALALCALRVIGWKNRSLAARRLSFLASALALAAAEQTHRAFSHTSSDLTTDQTDDQNPGSLRSMGGE